MIQKIIDYLDELYPNAQCELNYNPKKISNDLNIDVKKVLEVINSYVKCSNY